jgi:hypothetical protein
MRIKNLHGGVLSVNGMLESPHIEEEAVPSFIYPNLRARGMRLSIVSSYLLISSCLRTSSFAA